MSEHYVCIHGHFYQPPRENPWLESIELQDSASPYHDWNERITEECYATNAHARLIAAEGRIERLVNNYMYISFNFGPTLLSWMEEKAPETYAAIIAADAESRRRYAGHGSALGQAYNHMILPLANLRDKQTQVKWGIRDFERRFGRLPEGMWLPETAVDVETLEVLAGNGIQFTVLSPDQAQRIRHKHGGNWMDVGGGRIDPSRAYEAHLPGNKRIALFFYDAPISRAVAFERLLENGETFATRLMSGFSDSRTWPQLMHIATDGESYGHHHRHGEMALAFALQHIESTGRAKLTNYAEFLEKHPPEYIVEIVERTAWSCAHGVGRWERDCSCHTGARPTWNQAWRGPLRRSLDWVRDEVAPRFEAAATELLHDPWEARDAYIDVILDRSSESISEFLLKHQRASIPAEKTPQVLKLLELQRHALLMYTSCAWFFDDITGIETIQVLEYAARVVQLAQEIFDQNLEPGLLERLSEARSNVAKFGDGRNVYETLARPAAVDLMKVAAHYATSSLFEQYGEETTIYGYLLRNEANEVIESGAMRMMVGRVHVTSRVTRAESQISYAVLHQGDHNITGGVRESQSGEAYAALRDEAVQLFQAADLPGIIRFLDQQFRAATYSLHSLFREEQRRILEMVLEGRLRQTEAAHRQLFQSHAPLLRVLGSLNIPLPRAVLASVDFVLNTDLRETFSSEWPDLSRARRLLNEANSWKAVELDVDRLGYTLRITIERRLAATLRGPQDAEAVYKLTQLVAFARESPFPVDFSRCQNLYDVARREIREDANSYAADPAVLAWLSRFDELGRELLFRL